MRILFLTIIITILSINLYSQEYTKEMVKEHVVKAKEYALEVGKVEALKEFNKSKGKFAKGELYIFTISNQGIILSHSHNKRVINENAKNQRDLNGKYFIQEILDTFEKGEGWVTYYWRNPINKKVMKKKSYVLKVDDSYAVVGGFYIK